ncbi:L,D-transpeptidase [Streptomyces aidingensis]|uniref:Lipoprotein-anchoring transpeptidase ErfK/SrfK n=1 Tax=Streptomyces aidingensis TaxID=910347 RepID=A0A1I1NHT4_9ACTN|nr:Ig-like domain-containing protein [Streptomyces aidingensis]SFC97181.1 Lipoprotein-anchoring transpeptidase ErfK/SrfK [Streptomyces aidingensis]
MRTQPRSRGLTGAVAALLGVVLLLVSACTGSSQAGEKDSSGGGGGGGGKETAAPAVEIRISPEDGADSVATTGELKVTAANGTLTEVTVTGGPEDEQGEVPGELSEDKTGWEPAEPLANGSQYTVVAKGQNPEGETVEQTSTFTTVAAEATFDTQSLLWNWVEDGGEVGVGTIISITFTAPIENTDAVRDAIEVVTEPAVEVKGHWFGNQRLDFRPETYWEPGTEVTVKFRTRGVEGAPGVYGTRYNERSFVVGRSQVSTVDVAAKQMDVVRDGESIRTIPVTTGAPGMDTWNGKMVISEKFKETRMNGDTVGYGGEYDLDDVPHAMRLSNSGTFIHGNYWASPSTFGNANVSHGCVGLQDKQGADDSSMPGYWFYENSLIGDVVEVINSNDRILDPDNGLSGWNMAWSEWGG